MLDDIVANIDLLQSFCLINIIEISYTAAAAAAAADDDNDDDARPLLLTTLLLDAPRGLGCIICLRPIGNTLLCGVRLANLNNVSLISTLFESLAKSKLN